MKVKNEMDLQVAESALRSLVGPRTVYNTPEQWDRAEQKAKEIKKEISAYLNYLNRSIKY